ncbi:MAG: hypothetical protein Q9183_001230 [Haloplaca sp. 2 TL-2023]
MTNSDLDGGDVNWGDFLNLDMMDDNEQVYLAGSDNPCQAPFAPSQSGVISAPANNMPSSEATHNSGTGDQAATEHASTLETANTTFNQSTPWPAPAMSAVDMTPSHHQQSALNNASNNPGHSIDNSASNNPGYNVDNNTSNNPMCNPYMTADHLAPHIPKDLFEDRLVRDMVAQIDCGLKANQYDTISYMTQTFDFNHLQIGLWTLLDVLKARMHHPGFISRIGWAIDAFPLGEPNENRKPHDETIKQLGTELEQAKSDKIKADRQLGEQLKLAKLETVKADKRFNLAQSKTDDLRSKLQAAEKANEDREKKCEDREQQMLKAVGKLKDDVERLRTERDGFRDNLAKQNDNVHAHIQRQVQLKLQRVQEQVQQRFQELRSEVDRSNELVAHHAEHAIALQKRNQNLQAAVNVFGQINRQGPPPVLSTQEVLSRYQEHKGQPSNRKAASQSSPQMATPAPPRPASITSSGPDGHPELGQSSASTPYQRLLPDQIFSRRFPAQAQANMIPSLNGTPSSAPGPTQAFTQARQPLNGIAMQCQNQTMAPSFSGVSAPSMVQAASAYQPNAQATGNTNTQSPVAHSANPGFHHTGSVSTHNAALQAPSSEASVKNRYSIDLTQEDGDDAFHSHGSGTQNQPNLPSSPPTVGYATPPPSRRGSGHPGSQTLASSQRNAPTLARKPIPDWATSNNPQLTGAAIPNPMLPEQGKKQQAGAKRGREETSGEVAPAPSVKKAKTSDVANKDVDAQKKPAKKAVEKAPKERAPKLPRKTKKDKEAENASTYNSYSLYREQMELFGQPFDSKAEWLASRAAEKGKTTQHAAPASYQQQTNPPSSQGTIPVTSQHPIDVADDGREEYNESQAELEAALEAVMTMREDDPSHALPEPTAQQPDDDTCDKDSLFDEDEPTYDQQQESEESEEE